MLIRGFTPPGGQVLKLQLQERFGASNNELTWSAKVLNSNTPLCWLVAPGKSSPLLNYNSKTSSWHHPFLCFQMLLPWSGQPTSFIRQGFLCYSCENSHWNTVAMKKVGILYSSITAFNPFNTLLLEAFQKTTHTTVINCCDLLRCS